MFRVFGQPTNDPGTRVPFDTGADGAPAFLILRPMPLDVARAIESKYGKEEAVIGADGGKRIQRILGPEDRRMILADKIDWIWLDTVNVHAQMGDDDAAEVFRKAMDDESIKRDDWVPLDGRLRPRVKRFLCQKFLDLQDRIFEEENKLNKTRSRKERDLSGNS